jgi:hypothetical protein
LDDLRTAVSRIIFPVLIPKTLNFFMTCELQRAEQISSKKSVFIKKIKGFGYFLVLLHRQLGIDFFDDLRYYRYYDQEASTTYCQKLDICNSLKNRRKDSYDT